MSDSKGNGWGSPDPETAGVHMPENQEKIHRRWRSKGQGEKKGGQKNRKKKRIWEAKKAKKVRGPKVFQVC